MKGSQVYELLLSVGCPTAKLPIYWWLLVPIDCSTRNAVQVLLMFYFSFLCGQSGTTIFEDKTRMTFNFILSIPIIATGCFSADSAVGNRRQAANAAKPKKFGMPRCWVGSKRQKRTHTHDFTNIDSGIPDYDICSFVCVQRLFISPLYE